ncbi:MAG: MerR family transcriptional regulator [Clostridium sp.]|uniref:MerR family transcriptional regulator n=1 Tax=Clostridium sp. TaxID=1506 RepID=UPI00290637D4|nr:MerR family transcriptional regulator [Clostridium sp.]MDU5110614.1 MerR family transcriptional regulator [Clostridium sp.]
MTITEVSKMFNISADTLRYYERIGLIPAVNRTPGGIRDYTEEDCKWVEYAKCMRNSGVQVEALIEYVELFQKGDSTTAARKQILIDQRDILLKKTLEMQKTLERLNLKIERYEETLLKAENNLINH